MRRLILLYLLIVGTVAAVELESGFYDDDSPLLTYAGTWTPATDAIANGGAYSESSSPGASVSFETRSTAITIYYLSHAAGPDVEICVDAECSTINTAGADAATSAALSDLNDGLKIITLTSDSGIRFDGIYVHPLAEPEVTPDPAVQVFDLTDSSGNDFAGQLINQMTAGDVLIFSALIVLILLTGISITLQVVSNG